MVLSFFSFLQSSGSSNSGVSLYISRSSCLSMLSIWRLTFPHFLNRCGSSPPVVNKKAVTFRTGISSFSILKVVPHFSLHLVHLMIDIVYLEGVVLVSNSQRDRKSGFVTTRCCPTYNLKSVLLTASAWHLKHINWKDFLALLASSTESGSSTFRISDWYLRILPIRSSGCIMYSRRKASSISLAFWRLTSSRLWIVWSDMWATVEPCLRARPFLKKVFNFIYIFIFANILFGFLLILTQL